MAKTPQIRSTLKHFVNTSDDGTEKWNFINEGVTDLTEEFNSDTETLQYVGEANKTTFTKSYAPSLSLTMSVVEGDPANEYFRQKVNELPIGSAADTAYVRFNVLDKVTGETDTYTAYKIDGNLAIESIGGSAEDYLGMSVTINGKGTMQKGKAKLSVNSSGEATITFTPDTASNP